MAYGYLPTSYKALQESVSSVYKSMAPFSFRRASFKIIGDVTPEHRQQTENLKWQQEMFHRILNMIGLYEEGIVSERQLIATRSELLDTLIASPAEGECPAITRDKLLFLQELLYAKCISEEDYHLSKRPLLLRLAVQGAEIDSRDVILGGTPSPIKGMAAISEACAIQTLPEQETEWSMVEFKEDQSLLRNVAVKSTENPSAGKQKSPMKQMIHAISRLSLSPYKGGKPNTKDKHPLQSVIIPQSIEFSTSKDCCPVRNPPTLPMQGVYHSNCPYINPTESFKENPFWQIAGLIEESDKRNSEESALLGPSGGITTGAKVKVRKAFHHLFQKVQTDHSKESHSEVPHDFDSDSDSDSEEQEAKPTSRMSMWRLHLFNSWKKPSTDEETGAYLPLTGGSEEPPSPTKLLLKPHGGGPNTRKLKKKLHSNGAPTDFFIDKVLGENIKNELSRIRAELGTTTNPSPNFTNEQIEAIATRLPVDKNELKKFFPKSWCDRYGDIVLDVVRREFKDHVGEMENLHKAAREKRKKASTQTGFHDENCSPNCQRPEARKNNNSIKGGGGIPSHTFTTALPSPLIQQQSRSPSLFLPLPKSPPPLSQASHPPASLINKDSPSLSSSSSSFRKQLKSSSSLLQETPSKAVARNLYMEMSLEANMNKKPEGGIQSTLPEKTTESATCIQV